MKKLNFKKYKLKRKKSKHKTEWQEWGEKLTKYYGKNCYWLFWKYDLWRIKTYFKELEGDYDFTHLLAKLNKTMDKKKVAQRILNHYYKGDHGHALKMLRMSRSLLGEKAYKFLSDKLAEDTVEKAQLVMGGKIIKELNLLCIIKRIKT
jgi:hypothetical protein